MTKLNKNKNSIILRKFSFRKIHLIPQVFSQQKFRKIHFPKILHSAKYTFPLSFGQVTLTNSSTAAYKVCFEGSGL